MQSFGLTRNRVLAARRYCGRPKGRVYDNGTKLAFRAPSGYVDADRAFGATSTADRFVDALRRPAALAAP